MNSAIPQSLRVLPAVENLTDLPRVGNDWDFVFVCNETSGFYYINNKWKLFNEAVYINELLNKWGAMQQKQYAWSKETFGESTLESNIDHLRDELDEIIENPSDIEEWADVMLLYMNSAGWAGHTMGDIFDAVQKKYEKNNKRKWGKPDERGVVKHISEPSCDQG